MGSFFLRTATKADAPAIVEILNHYIATTASIFFMEPQTLNERLAWFDERSEQHPAIVAEMDNGIVGWAALSKHSPRGGYRHTADISVYVRPELHRQGIGRALVTELITRARAAGHHTLLAVCCIESRDSIALHESLGFQRVGEMREVGRKFDRWLDVAIFQLML